MWHALETYDPSKGSQPAWLTACAHYRMIEIVSGKKYTGQPARLHQHTRAEEPPTLSLDTPLNSDGGSLTLGDTVPDPSNPLERAGMAYHRAEIAAARRRLTPAQQLYVAARFYDQLTEREIRNSALFNRDPKLLWRDPKYGARAKLANELGHLRDSL
jgi:DNA-directed RNA polymerase specialized sigma24 family protein